MTRVLIFGFSSGVVTLRDFHLLMQTVNFGLTDLELIELAQVQK